MKKAIQIQTTLESNLKTFYKNLKPKNKRLARMSARIIIFMLFCLYFSGFVKTQLDLALAVIAIVILGMTLFFIKLKEY